MGSIVVGAADYASRAYSTALSVWNGVSSFVVRCADALLSYPPVKYAASTLSKLARFSSIIFESYSLEDTTMHTFFSGFVDKVDAAISLALRVIDVAYYNKVKLRLKQFRGG